MKEITIKIDGDYALVLFEFLAELRDGKRNVPDALVAERLALSHLESALESVLLEPFEENYSDLITNARSRIESSDQD